jgi:hypothetical protein
MNIFILDNDARKAAWYLCDKHVVKMILESAQLLSAAYERTSPYNGNGPYKMTHVNHPCTLWTKQSKDNYLWLIEHVEEMLKVYTHIYGKEHASTKVINWCKENMNELVFQTQGMTEFPLAMPSECKSQDAVSSYRNYYKKHKAQFATWKNRKIPEWFLC